MKETSLHWRDASKDIPAVKDYNADGFVIVAYEDGHVGKGYWTLNTTCGPIKIGTARRFFGRRTTNIQ